MLHTFDNTPLDVCYHLCCSKTHANLCYTVCNTMCCFAVHVYAEVSAAIPPEWIAAIAQGTTSAEIGEDAWWQDARGDYWRQLWRHSTTNTEEDDEETPVRMAQRYVREDGTPRVRAATENAMRAEHAPPACTNAVWNRCASTARHALTGKEATRKPCAAG